MQPKPSAGMFVAGFVMSVFGPLLGWIGVGMSTSASSNGAGLGAAAIGFLAALAGVILVCVAVYRALVKIDALPLVHQLSPVQPYWPAPPQGPPTSATQR